MRVKQDKYDRSRPPSVEIPVEPPPPQVINNIDISEAVKAIDKLTQAVIASKPTDNTKDVIFALKEYKEQSNERDRAMAKYLGEKVNSLMEALNKKPTSFEFDVKRDDLGLIRSVLVKPLRDGI
jgi:hypothetical protein